LKEEQSQSLALGSFMQDEFEMNEPTPPWLIDVNSNFKHIWSIIIFIFVSYITIITPYRIAFMDDSGVWWVVTDNVIDAIFIIDVIINFFTVEEDLDGVLIKNHKQLA
jgi:hypothetical protein